MIKGSLTDLGRHKDCPYTEANRAWLGRETTCPRQAFAQRESSPRWGKWLAFTPPSGGAGGGREQLFS